jgi:hypothetical protein
MTELRAEIGYCRDSGQRPRFYANAHEKDHVPLAPAAVAIHDARGQVTSLDHEGFVLAPHVSALADLADMDAVAAAHVVEIERLLLDLTGADRVDVGSRGILRYSERSGRTGSTDNSHPARFAHVDMSVSAAAEYRSRSAPPGHSIRRSAQYNVWRVLSDPPQDVPLALCAWPGIDIERDLIPCDAIFDPLDGSPEWSFENYLIRQHPAHRWYWYSDMTRDEALVFKTSDSDETRALCMPHGAFDNPLAGPDAPARISLEMRGTAFWFD